MVLFHFLSQVVVFLHFSFVIFALLGGLLLFLRKWIAWIHIPSAIWAVLTEWAGWPCPLTYLENWLRVKAGGLEYSSTFVMHYIYPVLYLEGLTRNIQILLGLLAFVLNIAIYALVWVFQKKRLRFKKKY
jgi:hypothetical protein